MNLIEKWKTRETKKKLREENIRLKAENKILSSIPKPSVCTVERNVQKICARISYSGMESRLPSEMIKYELKRKLMENIEPFIEYNFDKNGYGEENYTAILYVATGDRKYGR